MLEIPTSIHNITYTEKVPKYVMAKEFKTRNKLGELTARALTRTPILSVAALGGIEASHIAYAVEQGENLVKEIGKSGITLGTTLLASGYLGAIGAKYAGPCGSLIGVGLGSVIGYKTSKAFN